MIPLFPECPYERAPWVENACVNPERSSCQLSLRAHCGGVVHLLSQVVN